MPTKKTRTGWSKLSPDYKKRLQRNGVNRKQWESGADLRKSRGHSKDTGTKPTTKRQKELTDKAVNADLTPRQLRELEKTITRPKWIGNEVRTEVAAALAQLPNPKTWKEVQITPRDDGKAWTLVVFRKRGKYPIVIDIPGGGGAQGEAPREVIDLLTDLKDEAGFDFFFDVTGTDTITPKR